MRCGDEIASPADARDWRLERGSSAHADV
jgi:hypothetical protein